MTKCAGYWVVHVYIKAILYYLASIHKNLFCVSCPEDPLRICSLHIECIDAQTLVPRLPTHGSPDPPILRSTNYPTTLTPNVNQCAKATYALAHC